MSMSVPPVPCVNPDGERRSFAGVGRALTVGHGQNVRFGARQRPGEQASLLRLNAGVLHHLIDLVNFTLQCPAEYVGVAAGRLDTGGAE
jgi:hypothetical protein